MDPMLVVKLILKSLELFGMFTRVGQRTYAPSNPTPTWPLPAGNFNANILNWMDDKALIYTTRLSDFVTGEGRQYANVPTSFVKWSSKLATSFPNRWTTTSTWRCEYGTPDHSHKAKRQVDFVEDPINKPKTRKGSRPRIVDLKARGCQCRFITYELANEVTEIRYPHKRHINGDGKPCHRYANPNSKGLCHEMAHSPSLDCRYSMFFMYKLSWTLHAFIIICFTNATFTTFQYLDGVRAAEKIHPENNSRASC